MEHQKDFLEYQEGIQEYQALVECQEASCNTKQAFMEYNGGR